MQVSMTTVTMVTGLLLISSLTAGIPLQDRTRTGLEMTLSNGILRTETDRHRSKGQRPVQEDEQTGASSALAHIIQYMNAGGKSVIHSEPERHRETDTSFTDSLTDNSKTEIPKRVRRTNNCRRQTDDELMELLQSIGGLNTRYADKSHQDFTSLLSFPSNPELSSLTKVEIEAALRSNVSKEHSHPHLHVIRSSLITPEEANVPRVKRDVIGTMVTSYCVTRGQESVPGFKRPCDACDATTTLTDDLFPRYVNEVVCSSNTECLQGGGQCNERKLNINILRRTEHCSVATSTSDQVFYVEDWEPTMLEIRVACECDIKVDSIFADYV